MRKVLISLTIMIAFGSNSLFAIKPIATIPSDPNNFEVFTENEEIFLEKYLEYYIPAVMLQTQLRMVGVDKFPKLPTFSFQVIENLEVKKLKEIAKVAKDLTKQVEVLPESYNPALINCEKVKSELESQLFHLSLDTIGLSKEKKYIEKLKKKLEEIVAQSEKNEMEYNQKYQKLVKENFELKYYGTIDKEPMQLFLVKVTAKGSQLFLNSNDIEKGVFPSFNIDFEAVNIAQQRASISLWSEYSLQTTKVKINPISNSNDRQHYSEQILAFGADIGLNLSKLFSIKRIKWDFDLGFGYFKGFVNHTNYNYPKSEYQGNIIKVETSFHNFSRLTPFGIHFGAYFNRFADDIIYYKEGPPVILRSSWRPSIYAGISFNLIQIYK